MEGITAERARELMGDFETNMVAALLKSCESQIAEMAKKGKNSTAVAVPDNATSKVLDRVVEILTSRNFEVEHRTLAIYVFWGD